MDDLAEGDFRAYDAAQERMIERGVQERDTVYTHISLKPNRHHKTGGLCLKVAPSTVVDWELGPHWCLTGNRNGLVAWLDVEEIAPGDKFVVAKRFGSSCKLVKLPLKEEGEKGV